MNSESPDSTKLIRGLTQKISQQSQPNGTRFLRLVLGRSLFPLTGVVIILGTTLWGPWISLILALSWFLIVLIWLG